MWIVVKTKSTAALTVLSLLESTSVHTLTYLIKQICYYYTIIIANATDSLKKPLLLKLYTWFMLNHLTENF